MQLCSKYFGCQRNNFYTGCISLIHLLQDPAGTRTENFSDCRWTACSDIRNTLQSKQSNNPSSTQWNLHLHHARTANHEQPSTVKPIHSPHNTLRMINMHLRQINKKGNILTQAKTKKAHNQVHHYHRLVCSLCELYHINTDCVVSDNCNIYIYKYRICVYSCYIKIWRFQVYGCLQDQLCTKDKFLYLYAPETRNLLCFTHTWCLIISLQYFIIFFFLHTEQCCQE